MTVVVLHLQTVHLRPSGTAKGHALPKSIVEVWDPEHTSSSSATTSNSYGIKTIVPGSCKPQAWSWSWSRQLGMTK